MTIGISAVAMRPMLDGDEPAVRELLRASLAGGPTGERTAEFFAWKHRHNPFGQSYILVAEAAGDIVGLRAFLRWDLVAGDTVVRAVRAVDTATHPDYQGRGIFKHLTLSALEELREHTDLVFNTPNSQSLPGYLKMGWQHVTQVPVHLRPARPLRFAARAFGSRHPSPSQTTASGSACTLSPASEVFAELSRMPDSVDQLLHCRATDALSTRRDLGYLAWRYAQPPGLDYRAISIRDGGSLRGLAVGRLRRRGRLIELTLTEVLSDDEDTAVARRLLHDAAHSGVDHVTLVAPRGTAAAKVAVSCGFLPIGRSRGPVLVTNPLRPCPVDPVDPDRWSLWLGDLELF